jgi:UDP-N-acetylmuramyl pentapeptide phosphotransferase/UDP-N-acetylglucosamine-1-phosphate transferase
MMPNQTTPVPTPGSHFIPLAQPQSEFSPTTLVMLLLGFAVLLTLAPLLARLCCRLFRLEKANFRGDVIPAATGIGTLIVAIVVYGGLSATDAPLAAAAPLFLITAVGYGLLGLLDDRWGSRAVGGFRGHLKSLASGRPTTGAFKLIGGGLIALAVGFLLEGPHAIFRILLDGLIIALAANTLNLLDVRPGRAQFGFLLLTLPTLWGVFHPGWVWVLNHAPSAVLLGPIALAALVEWWPDSRGRAMMGDTGSNLLGATAGLAAVTVLPLSGRFFLLAALLTINWLAEKVSLSELIEQNRFLRAFDRQLGAR